MSVRIVTAAVSDLATLSGSDWLSGLPASNLQLEGRSRVARTANASGTKTVLGDFASGTAVSCCILYNHNLTSSATWRLRLYDGAGQTGSVVYDSGTIAALPGLAWGDFPWGLAPWGATVFTGWGSAYSVMWFAAVAALSFKLELTDTTNPAGYLQAKRLLLGAYFEPGVNFAEGLSVDWRDNSEQSRTNGGSLRTDRRARFRRMQGEIKYLTSSERAVFLDLMRQVGLATETFISIHPGTGGATERDHSMLGKFTQMPGVSAPFYGAYQVSQFNFEEV